EDGVASCLQIALQKHTAHVTIPEIGPALEEWHILLAHGRLPESAVGSVLERSHHAGNITQRGSFQFSFAERSSRFPFEIKDDEVFSGVEQLTKVIVAMNADFRGIRATVEQPFFAREYFLFGAEHFLRLVTESRRKVA